MPDTGYVSSMRHIPSKQLNLRPAAPIAMPLSITPGVGNLQPAYILNVARVITLSSVQHTGRVEYVNLSIKLLHIQQHAAFVI